MECHNAVVEVGARFNGMGVPQKLNQLRRNYINSFDDSR